MSWDTYLPTPSIATEHPTLAGCKMHDISGAGGGAQWVASVSSKNSEYAALWDFHQLIKFSPQSLARPITLEVIDQGNQLRQFARRLQMVADSMYWTAHGIFGFDEQDVINATNRFGWTLISAGGYTATLRRDSGQADPNNITISVFSKNPDWIPGENTRYITTTSQNKMPAHCFMKIEGNSKMNTHAGFIVESWNCPNEINEGDTFSVTLRTPIFPEAAQKMDSGDSTGITATFEFYVGNFRPVFVDVVDEEHFYGIRNTNIVTLPVAGTEIVLEATKRIRWPDGDSHWLQVDGRLAASQAEVDLTSTFINRVSITHVDPSQYKSAVDISGLDLSLYDQLAFTYWLESTDNDAQPCGGTRCAFMKRDWSDSVYDDTVVDGGESWICTNSSCPATPRKNCYDTTVAGFALETPTKAGNQQMWQQPMFDTFFHFRQVMEGFSKGEITRIGTPSLALVSGLYYDLPGGFHALAGPLFTGGFKPLDISGDTVVVRNAWKQDWDNPGVGGPAYSNVTRKKEIGTDNEDNFIRNAQIFESDVSIDPYNGTLIGSLANYQRVEAGIKLAINNIDTLKGENVGVGCSLVKGNFDINFQETSVAEDIVYYGYIQISQNLDIYNRTDDYSTGGGIKTTAIIAAATDNGDGTYDLELENKIVQAGSAHPTIAQQEIITQWASGGTNVRPEDSQAVNNYLSDYRYRGPMSDTHAQAGNVVRMVDSTFADDVRNKRFWITDVAAYDGSLDSWIPGTTFDWRARSTSASYIVLGLATESVDSITITRNGGAVTLTGSQGHPFPASLNQDVYVWDEFIDDDDNKRVVFKFSHLNMTGDPDEEIFNITILTTIDGSPAGTYTVSAFNIQTGDGSPFYTTLQAPTGSDPQCLATITMDDDITDVLPVVNYLDPFTGAYTEIELDEEVPITSQFSELQSNQWTKIVNSAQEWIVITPAQYMGNAITYRVSTNASFGGTESEFFDGYIGIHGASLKVNYETFGRKRDRVTVRNELNLLPAPALMAGKSIQIANNGCVHYSESGKEPDIRLYKALSETIQSLVSSNYSLHGADGTIWLKIPFDDNTAPTTIRDHDCIFLELWVANRKRMFSGVDTTSIQKTIERMLSE